MSKKTDPQSTPKPDLKHELRTYITAIMGYIELFRETFEKQAKANGKKIEFPADLENIWMAANLLAALVEDAEPVSGKGYGADEEYSEVDLNMNSPTEAGQRLRSHYYRTES
ncbi:MAG: HAMP domain-containing histidine kinase [Chloroflexi bacterium]|nr:HAMP domain-containing histidine kinase [Chloroflexota bacterium]